MVKDKQALIDILKAIQQIISYVLGTQKPGFFLATTVNGN